MKDNTASYWSGQGEISIGLRNSDGSRQPARWLFDASVLSTKQTVSREEMQESYTGSRSVAATMNTKKAMSGSLTLRQRNTDIAALALDGVRVEVTSGSVTNEVIGDVVPGDVWFLNYAAISDLELEDGAAAALVADTDYVVNEELGALKFLTTKSGVKAAAYDYAAHSIVTMFEAGNQDYYIVYAGMNTVDGTSEKERAELYNVTILPAEEFGYIQSGFGELQLSFECKLDPVRKADPNWGGFGRRIQVAG